MGGHSKRRMAKRPERSKIKFIKFRRRGIDARQRKMAIGRRPPMTRHMLDDGQHAAGKTAIYDRSSQGDHRLGIGTIGTVADNLMGAFLRHIEHGHGVNRNSQRVEFLGDQSRSSEGGACRQFRIGLV